jgi:hypothetical protein
MRLLSNRRLSFKIGLLWIFVDVILLLFSIFPSWLNCVSHFFGIASPVNMLFFFGFIFAIVLIFSLSMEVTKLSDRVKKLSQELAILRKDALDPENRSLKEKDIRDDGV